MSLELNWAFIDSGSTFQSLVSALILHDEDSFAFPFGRPGPDMGQDILSGNQEIVYQAKFHRDESAASAIRDAKIEAENINKYRNTDGIKKAVWQAVTHWVLVTNAVFNASDRQKWEDEVIPLFGKMGITATYWEKENLDSRLRQHPELARSYFGGETRVLLSPLEASETLARLNFFPEALTIPFSGREDAFQTVTEFLNTPQKQILIVHGPGGIGKSRFLLENAQKIQEDNKNWQVYWALIEEMEKSSHWYQGIIPEKDTLLFIDEPENENLLKRLIEQSAFSNSRSHQWKFIVAARSPKDPVLKYLKSANIRGITQELVLESLVEQASIQLCTNLLNQSGTLSSAKQTELQAKWITDKFQGFPVWMTMAVQLLKLKGDLSEFPQTTTDLANTYINEIVRTQQDFEPQKIHETLKWLALLGVLNTENEIELDYLSLKALLKNTSELKRILSALVQRKILFQEGSRDRLHKIKPDVLQDHLLKEWLTLKFGAKREATDEAKVILNEIEEALKQGRASKIHYALLRNLTRLDFMLDYMQESTKILKNLLQKIHQNISEWSESAQVDLITHLPIFSPLYANEVLSICEAALNFSVRAPQGQERILSSISRCVNETAAYVVSKSEQNWVLDILLKVADLKSQISDTLTKTDHLTRILSGGPGFLSDFSSCFFERGKAFLSQLMNQNALQVQDQFLLSHLIKPQLSVERRRSYSYNPSKFVIEKFVIAPGRPEWNYRKELITLIFALLSKHHLSENENILLWRLLEESLSTMIRGRPAKEDDPDFYQTFKEVLIDEISNIFLCIQTNTISLKELQAARKVWDWFCEYEKDEQIKLTAKECEKWFIQKAPYVEYEPLIDWRNYQQMEQRSNEKGLDLASSDEKTITEFVDQGIEYLGRAQNIPRLFSVARGMAQVPEIAPGLTNYLKKSLSLSVKNPHFQFAGTICRSLVWKKRREQNGKAALAEFLSLLAYTSTIEQKVILADYVYETSWIGQISEAEANLVFQLLPDFHSQEKLINYLSILGGLALANLSEFRRTAEQALTLLSLEQKGMGTNALLEGLYYVVLNATEQGRSSEIDTSLGLWMLERVLDVPDIDQMGGNYAWYLQQFLELTKRPDISWLIHAIEKRLSMYEQDQVKGYSIFPISESFISFIEPIDDQTFRNKDIVNSASNLLAKILQPHLGTQALTEYLAEIDPKGLLVPDLAVESLNQVEIRNDSRKVNIIASIAGYYNTNDIAWRKIAHEICLIIDSLSDSKKHSIMHSLKNQNHQAWSAPFGEVPKKFILEFKSAKENLENEKDPVLIPFRKWVLEDAEAALRHEEERVKEFPSYD